MPNGVSCVYFAIKNRINANEQQNGFKGAISDIQSLRSADAIASGVQRTGLLTENLAKASAPLTKFLGKAASVVRKLVYPLIVCSGVYETAKSDDKVKTGTEVAGGITTMYTFEQISETLLLKFRNYTNSLDKVKNNKKLQALFYLLRGAAFVAASITGYKTGRAVAGKAIQGIRNSKSDKPVDEAWNKIEGVSAKNGDTFQKTTTTENSGTPSAFSDITSETNNSKDNITANEPEITETPKVPEPVLDDTTAA